jgi:DNA-binding transcriptional regulator YhcF (GntR family)
MDVTKHIADTYRERITSGEYLPGDKLPSVRRMATEFNCGIETIGMARRILINEGLIETAAFKTIVSGAVIHPVGSCPTCGHSIN